MMLTNCGISSMRNLRRKRPMGVMRASFSSASTGPQASSASLTMVRSLCMRNGFMPLPTRSCEKSTGKPSPTAIAVGDGFPVLFSQERVGRGMKPFRMHKLRTMVKDAEEACGPVLAEENDARITPMGRFLRRFRIDEIPQFVNIIKGEMSFVGPRPERLYFVERYIAETPGYRERFNVKPGVTGLAQVSGGYATTPERKLKYDLIYMYHQTLAMDAQIVAETLRVVLTGRGAR